MTLTLINHLMIKHASFTPSQGLASDVGVGSIEHASTGALQSIVCQFAIHVTIRCLRRGFTMLGAASLWSRGERGLRHDVRVAAARQLTPTIV